MMHMVLITQGTSGDVMPFLGIGNALKARGHMVTVFTHHGYMDLVRQAGLDFLVMDSPHEFAQFIADGALLNDLRGIPTFFQRHILPKAIEHFEAIRALYRPGGTIIIARHLADIAGRIAAEKLGIPLVRVFTAPAQAQTTLVLAAMCRDILAPDIDQIRALVDLPRIQNWKAWAAAPAHSLALWPDWFAAPAPGWPMGTIPVGFVRYTEAEIGELPAEVEAFLDRGAPPILITGSTGTFTIDGFYTASAEACHLLGRKGIIVSRQRQEIPNHLSENVKWFTQLPFASLIPRVGAIVHHGGMGTVAHAIAAGIPQVALPHGGDRPDVGAHIHQLGIGVCLHPSQCTAPAIAKVLERLLQAPGVRERCGDFARRLRATDPAALAGETIDTLIQTSTPVADPATWCQAATNHRC